MKVTKYVHSCLLVETPEANVLIDPGVYTYRSHLLAVNKLERLDYIVVTHEHPDHFYPPMLQLLSNQFPNTPIVTNNELAEDIGQLSLSNPIITGSEENLQVFEIAHAPLTFRKPAPLNIGVHVAGVFTHPGDGLKLSHSRDVLALAVGAPWGSLKQALENAAKINPKAVIPVHDWPWHNQARREMYTMAKELLAARGIAFIEPENGVSIKL